MIRLLLVVLCFQTWVVSLGIVNVAVKITDTWTTVLGISHPPSLIRDINDFCVSHNLVFINTLISFYYTVV